MLASLPLATHFCLGVHSTYLTRERAAERLHNYRLQLITHRRLDQRCIVRPQVCISRPGCGDAYQARGGCMHEIGSCAQSAATGGSQRERDCRLTASQYCHVDSRWCNSISSLSAPRGGYCQRREKLPTLSAPAVLCWLGRFSYFVTYCFLQTKVEIISILLAFLRPVFHQTPLAFPWSGPSWRIWKWNNSLDTFFFAWAQVGQKGLVKSVITQAAWR